MLQLLWTLMAPYVLCTVFEAYKPCEITPREENRELYAITCDTRIGYKSVNAMKVWNITGHLLRQDGVTMANVCYGHPWEGFLTKPLVYLNYIRSLPEVSAKGGKVHVLYMDSDTFWAVNDVKTIWRNYDCARQGRDLVISTEMSCWVGRYCTKEDLARWYSSDLSPSYSPFINSGAGMGTTSALIHMLDFVVKNNASYFLAKPNGRMKFDDQFAIADYILTAGRSRSALDYQQRLLGSSAAIGSRVEYLDRQPFICRNATGHIVTGCFDFSTMLSRHGFYALDKATCLVSRAHRKGMQLGEEMTTLAPAPVVWHANGVGRRTILAHGHKAYLCALQKRGLSDSSYMETALQHL